MEEIAGRVAEGEAIAFVSDAGPKNSPAPESPIPLVDRAAPAKEVVKMLRAEECIEKFEKTN